MDQEEGRKARVFVVDDHPIVRQGIMQLIGGEPDLEVCGEAADMQTALRKIAAAEPHLVVADLSLGGGDGIELIKNVRARNPAIRFLVLTMHDDLLHVERALRAGAQGFLTKQEAAHEVLTAVHAVLDGEMYLSPRLSPKLLAKLLHGGADSEDGVVGRLSDRELQVFRMIGQGKSTKEIAAALHLSVKTVESYRANIKEKLDLPDARSVVLHATRWVLSLEK